MADPDLQIRGGGGGSHLDPEKRGGQSQKNFFQPFEPQFGLKIRGRSGGWGGPGPSPGSGTGLCDPCLSISAESVKDFKQHKPFITVKKCYLLIISISLRVSLS